MFGGFLTLSSCWFSGGLLLLQLQIGFRHQAVLGGVTLLKVKSALSPLSQYRLGGSAHLLMAFHPETHTDAGKRAATLGPTIG